MVAGIETVMAGLKIEIADLPNGMLGEASENVIRIDRDAAGYRWFVDATPGDDAEFVADDRGILAARKDSAAADRAGLLTTVMHEMGHALGYSHSVSDGLMNALLPLGTLRTDLDSAVPAYPPSGKQCSIV